MPPRIGPKKPVRIFLRSWRIWRELTLEQLGARFDPPVSKGTVKRWEKATHVGTISTGVVAAYAEAVDRPIMDMYRPAPPKGIEPKPSLDAVAADLDEKVLDKAVEFIASLPRRRA